MIVPSDLIGAMETCEMLGIDRSTLTRRIQAGTVIPLAQLDGPGGAYVFDRTEVQALVQEQAKNPPTRGIPKQ
jgi:predicted site-specific integrase-resolvase